MTRPPWFAAALALTAASLVGCGQSQPASAPAPSSSSDRAATVAATSSHVAGAAHPTPATRAPAAATTPPAAGASPPIPASVIQHGPRTRRWVALTFDADMTRGMLAMLASGRVRSWYDAALFAELRATRTPATIFLTGLWTARYPEVVRRLARDPLFELENHSLDHAGWTTPCYGLPTVTGQPSKTEEIGAAARIIQRVAGVRPRYFRFPGGCEREADVRLVARFGERPVGWDVVSGDAFEPDPRVIVHAVLSGVRPGSIVIAHCIGAPNTPATARAMATIIPALRARGYRFVTLRELLGAALK